MASGRGREHSVAQVRFENRSSLLDRGTKQVTVSGGDESE